MRFTISRNAAKYSGRAFRLGRMREAGIDQREQSRRPQGTALKPSAEHCRLACARMQVLRQSQKAATVKIPRTREHHREAGHEEPWPRACPARDIEFA